MSNSTFWLSPDQGVDLGAELPITDGDSISVDLVDLATPDLDERPHVAPANRGVDPGSRDGVTKGIDEPTEFLHTLEREQPFGDPAIEDRREVGEPLIGAHGSRV